jgi:hypothetical protein
MTTEKYPSAAFQIYQQIREILIQARSRALQVVNTEMADSS